jgi:predicted RNase H-like HicB family nuclease
LKNYIAVIHKVPVGEYRVTYPDFPGLLSGGSDLDEARALAEETLTFHIDGLVDDNRDLPEPSSLDSIMANSENRSGIAVLLNVAVNRLKFVKVQITIREDVLSEVDAFAEAHGVSRSVFMARAAKREIDRV